MGGVRERLVMATSASTLGLLLACLGLMWSSPIAVANAQNVYRTAVHGTVWIVNPVGWFREVQGSGYLADKERMLVVTNHHVLQNSTAVDVYFPVRDARGVLVQDQQYYRRNKDALARLGYYTKGQVIAFDSKKDLAILRLYAIPKEVEPLLLANANPAKKESLHVVGHPSARPLWTYCPGVEAVVDQFRAVVDGEARDFRAVIYKSGLFHGNSGGPVLNEQGRVVGINACAGGEGNMYAIAVHWSEIDDLMQSIEKYYVVGIENTAWGVVRYEFRWGEEPWRPVELKGRKRMVHWYRGEKAPTPYIRFDCSAEEGFQKKAYELKAYLAYLGRNVQPDFDRDASEYFFRWVDSKTLDLLFRR